MRKNYGPKWTKCFLMKSLKAEGTMSVGKYLCATKILGFTRTNVLVNIVEQEDWGGLEPTPENFAFDPTKPMYADGSCYEGTDPDFAATGVRVSR